MERNTPMMSTPPLPSHQPQGAAAEGSAPEQQQLMTPTTTQGSPPGSSGSPLPEHPPPFSSSALAAYPPPFPTLTVTSETEVAAVGSGAGPPKFDDLEPPPYNAVVKLPTYEEAQQEKMMEGGEGHHHLHHLNGGGSAVGDSSARNGGGPGNFSLMMSSFGGHHHHHSSGESAYDTNTAELALGTDVYFFASFLIAFLFNWIGFLLLMCACHTVAGRYGALAGFGLSLAKWTLIVKHSTDLASNDNNWLWWLIMAFGVLICVRAVIQYLCIKREWHRLSRAAQERVVFFY